MSFGFARVSSVFILLVFLPAFCAAAASHSLDDAQLTSRARQLASAPDQYGDKVYGAWYGKMIGLILGQPTEGWPKQEIERKAREVDAYPITYYLPSTFKTHMSNYLLENLNGSPPNDDVELMLAAFLALREHGIGLTSRQIAQTWAKYVGGGCTAEGVALNNFRNGIWPPASATFENPYQEWIGAQMRVDIWGMIAPGMPQLAARYAAMDASISHTRNGVFGAQFMAAALATAMVEKDPETVIRTALRAVPHDSIYAEAIRDVLQWHKDNQGWEAAWELLDAKWGVHEDGTRDRPFKNDKYNTRKGRYQWADWKWVYADVNGAICALALLYGEGDFCNTICIATMCGFDNDCNAGNVGAIVGAMIGEKAIPQRWKDPIGDIYYTGIGMDDGKLKISKLAEETTQHGLQVMKNYQ